EGEVHEHGCPSRERLSFLPESIRRTARTLVRNAVIKILERGVPENSGLDGFGREELEARLFAVANNMHLTWLTAPFLDGLIKGGRAINQRVSMPQQQEGEPHPILHWLCQYKLLQQFAYCGGDDMVALALKAGADVKAKVSNRTNALFFAVKYTSARCVEMLLDAGVNVKHKDIYGHTIWKNAVEWPNLEIIEVLNKRCNETIPVSEERFYTSSTWDGIEYVVEYYMPDQILSLYCGVVSTSEDPDSNIARSWMILGDPTIEDLAVALVRLMQAGSRFSPYHALSSEHIDPLSIVTHIDSPMVKKESFDQFQYDTICYLRNVIYGLDLPKTIRQEVDVIDQKSQRTNDTTCPICLEDVDCSETCVTLYCGHRYCVECIDAFAKNALNENVVLRGNGDDNGFFVDWDHTKEKRCPMCRNLLCGDLLTGSISATARRGRYRFGVDRHYASGEIGDGRGPHVLTNEQLKFECIAVGAKSEGTRQELLKELNNYVSSVEYKMGTQDFRMKDGTTIAVNVGSDMKLELSATASVVSDGDNPVFVCPPDKGPVVVTIEVKSVPVLAWLSPYSLVTVVPISVVNSFGFKTKPLSSSQFTGFDRSQISVVAVVEEFKFRLGSIEVCLTNAVVLSEESDLTKGIRLGMDFFESAAWTRCSTRFAGDIFVVSDAGYTKNLFLPEQKDELRYYSRDGKICQLPFIHVENMADSHYIPVVTLDYGLSKTSFDECQWCCRCFPSDGMLKCEDKGTQHYNRHYCDEECKSQGESIRARISGLKEDL
ncbi:hypothetical protein ACHAXR_011382, partial [Thalassiosira sp. AJA248-18]